MAVVKTKVQSISGQEYNFQVFPLNDMTRLNSEGIYILTAKDEYGKYNHIYKSKSDNMHSELSGIMVGRMIAARKATHVLVKFPFSKTSLKEAWKDISLDHVII